MGILIGLLAGDFKWEFAREVCMGILNGDFKWGF